MLDFTLSYFTFFALQIWAVVAAAPAPKNVRFDAAGQTNVTIKITGIANVSQYQIDIQALYDVNDRKGWIVTMENGPTTSDVYFDQINGLKSNRLYYVTVAGISDGTAGDVAGTIVRTAPKTPKLFLAQTLPTVISLFAEEIPGATLCEISYAKVGHESGRKAFRSEYACRAATIRGLEANTQYSIRARVLTSGEFTYSDSEFGEALKVTTAKHAIFGRVLYNIPYDATFDDPSSENYVKTKGELQISLLRYYKNLGADAFSVRVLELASKHSGASTIVHHEVLINSPSMPTEFGGYSFSTASGTYSLEGMIANVADNSYSLRQTEDEYEINFEKSLPCTSHDIRKLKMTGSVSRTDVELEVQAFSLVTRSSFQIADNELLKPDKSSQHSFENNSAIVISQNYLLRTCPVGSRDLYYTRYYESASVETTPGLQDVFVHSTGLNITPETYSAGVDHGNASIITFRRIPNAIKYFISSGDVNVTMDHFAIDSTDIFWIRIPVKEPGANIPAELIVTTKPYDITFEKQVLLNLTTLPSLPSSVNLPYRDKFNLTLKWAPDSAALGYYIWVVYERYGDFVQKLHIEEPIAEIHNLTPGRYYYVYIIPYNYAGNRTVNDDLRYRLYTDQDPPVMSIHPVNVSSSHITVQWTGGFGADDITIRILNNSGILSSAPQMKSPTSIFGLDPFTEYNVTVIATFETGVSQSPLITFRTDPLPPILSTTPINITDKSIAVNWTGTEEATYVDLQVSNTTTSLFWILNVESPFDIKGLRPGREYVIEVVGVYGSTQFFSNNATFRTDPAPNEPAGGSGNVTVTETKPATEENAENTLRPDTVSRNQTDSSDTSPNGSNSTTDTSLNNEKPSNALSISDKDKADITEDKEDKIESPDLSSNSVGVNEDRRDNNDTSTSRRQELTTSDADATTSEESTEMAGWAWMLIGGVVAVATIAAILVAKKVAINVMNSKAPVESGNANDNKAFDNNGTESTNANSSNQPESLRMEQVHPDV